MRTTIEVICYKYKPLKNKELPIKLRVTKNRKRKYIPLGISVKPEHWDFEKNKPTIDCPNREEIEVIISNKIKEYQKQILEYKVLEKDFTVSTLVEKVSNPIKGKTVKSAFDLYIQQLLKANRIRYADMFKVTLKSLIDFNGHLDIYFSDIDVSWLKKCEAWMLGKGLASNTLELRFVRLRTVFNFAIEEGMTKQEYYPFGTFKVSKLKQKTAKRSK